MSNDEKYFYILTHGGTIFIFFVTFTYIIFSSDFISLLYKEYVFHVLRPSGDAIFIFCFLFSYFELLLSGR